MSATNWRRSCILNIEREHSNYVELYTSKINGKKRIYSQMKIDDKLYNSIKSIINNKIIIDVEYVNNCEIISISYRYTIDLSNVRKSLYNGYLFIVSQYPYSLIINEETYNKENNSRSPYELNNVNDDGTFDVKFSVFERNNKYLEVHILDKIKEVLTTSDTKYITKYMDNCVSNHNVSRLCLTLSSMIIESVLETIDISDEFIKYVINNDVDDLIYYMYNQFIISRNTNKLQCMINNADTKNVIKKLFIYTMTKYSDTYDLVSSTPELNKDNVSFARNILMMLINKIESKIDVGFIVNLIKDLEITINVYGYENAIYVDCITYLIFKSMQSNTLKSNIIEPGTPDYDVLIGMLSLISVAGTPPIMVNVIMGYLSSGINQNEKVKLVNERVIKTSYLPKLKHYISLFSNDI